MGQGQCRFAARKIYIEHGDVDFVVDFAKIIMEIRI